MSLSTIVDTTSNDIGFKASVVTGFGTKIHEAAVQATREVFERDILPAAKAGTPVASGNNRDSIAVSFRDNLESFWVSAWLITQSGYGWLIEHGTSHDRKLTLKAVNKRHGKVPVNDRTPAHPYIYPAIKRFVGSIPERARELIESESFSHADRGPELDVSASGTLEHKGPKKAPGATNLAALWQQFVRSDPATRGDWARDWLSGKKR
jgi:hypothetical protein